LGELEVEKGFGDKHIGLSGPRTEVAAGGFPISVSTSRELGAGSLESRDMECCKGTALGTQSPVAGHEGELRAAAQAGIIRR
jgi:hypothetical protein